MGRGFFGFRGGSPPIHAPRFSPVGLLRVASPKEHPRLQKKKGAYLINRVPGLSEHRCQGVAMSKARTIRGELWAAATILLLLVSLFLLPFPSEAIDKKRCWLGVCGMQCNANFDDCVDTPNQQSWCSLLIVVGCATEPYSLCCRQPFTLF